MNRRDILMGGALIAAAGSAAILTPRKRLVLLGDRKLENVIPTRIADWVHVPSEGFVLPKTPGSLADRLYSQTLTRLYQSPTRVPVMLVIAYGAVQNDLLQLHRPEVCYAAVGYTISQSRVGMVRLGPDAELPVRALTARTDLRIEPVVYWTRVGDDLPTDGSEQRRVKLQQQMHGFLSDGVLVRMSTVGEPSAEVFATLGSFAGEMVRAMKSGDRKVLIGRPLAAKLSA